MKLHLKSLLNWAFLTTLMAMTPLFSFAADSPQMPTRTIGYSIVEPHSIDIESELSGRTIASFTAEVRPQVTGIITQVFFTGGSNVKKGDTLYQIDPSQYQATLDSAKASLLSAKANLIQATSEFSRYKNLLSRKVASQSEYDAKRAVYLEAQAQVKQAQAAIKLAQINLNYTTIKSPISGHIGRSNYTVGALVTANQATQLVTVQTLNPMYVDLTSSANTLLAFRRAVQEGIYTQNTDTNPNVSLYFEDDSTYDKKGQFLFTDTNIDQTTSSFVTRISFPNDENVLLPGLFVRAKLKLGTIKKAITVPLTAVQRTSNGSAYVYLLDDENKVISQAVTTGNMTNANWIIQKGLKTGDKVIISGLQFVRPGATIKNPIKITIDSKNPQKQQSK